ncbi:MAG: ABC transporter ATP-binding protein [Candidatus Liptonbacteria bacterium]|nr:ABC transporter ATP-binding protein [Candidatus Liptonbacteria bacterium]
MEKVQQKKVGSIDVLRYYINETKRYPWVFGLAFLATVGVQVSELAAPLYLKQFFDILAAYAPSSDIIHKLFILVGIFGLVSFGGWIARRTQAYSLSHLESYAIAGLYSMAFDYLIKHSYHFFISRFAGTLTRRVSKFAMAYETIVDSIMFQFFPTVLFAIGAVVFVFLRNSVLGIALGTWVIFFILFQLIAARLRQPLRIARTEADSRAVGAIADAISNQNTITLFSGSKHEGGIFRKVIDYWRSVTIRVWRADELIWSFFGIFTLAINVGLLYGAVIFWQKGLLTIGDFVLIQSYLMVLFNRLVSMNRELRRFYDSFADAVEMVEMLETPHEVRDILGAKPFNATACEIDFRDVSFYFNEGRPVLKDFNLNVKGGEKLALVGPSGAGKTTVTKLLLRLYDVTGGSIKIDGQNISEVMQESLRDAIAFVPQEPILFHRTLMENIRYGRRDASEEEVIMAAKKAHCHEFISAMPEGYQTFVGERGVKLSGGERQRVAIARAILKSAPILVLDEATSSLDSESEALIQDALQTLMQGKTVIVIAHRLSTIMKMDRIVVIENGKVVAEGTHRDLLEQGGLYKKLWSIQAGGFADDEPLSENELENEIESFPEKESEQSNEEK